MARYVIAVLLAVLLLTILRGTAEAHANLVQSDPPGGATLDVAPRELVLAFSEALDPSFSRVQLFDSAHQIVNAGPGTIDPTTPLVLRLPLGDLPRGSYTAVWRVLSAVDGHITEGSVPFGIGVTLPKTSLLPPPGAPDPMTIPPSPFESLVRWLNLLTVTVAFGGLPFGLFVWRPAYAAAQGVGADLSASDASMTRAIQLLILIGGGLFLLANLLFLLVQAAGAAGVPLTQAIGAPFVQILGGRLGQLWIGRMVLAAVIVAIAQRLPLAGKGTARPWWVMLAMGSMVLLTFSLNSHSAAAQQGVAIAVAADWLHIAAMVAWLGGLIPLVHAIHTVRRQQADAPPLAILIPYFSRLALISVTILILTGVYSYSVHINRFDLLTATTYGQLLLAKTGMFGLLLLLGAMNLLFLSPRLRMAGNRLARAFHRTVHGELVVGALALLAAGAMTSIVPSRTAWEAQERLGLKQTATLEGVQLALWVAPGQIGENEFAVDVMDRRPGAQSVPAKVLLRMMMAAMDMGALQVDMEAADIQRYVARGNYISMGGRWNIEVVLRRQGFNDVVHTFEVDVLRSTLASGDSSTPMVDDTALVGARLLFETNCLVCHGPTGRGDGPAAASLDPRPADLTATHVKEHPDEQIYGWIHDGVPGSAMPAFGAQLNDEQIRALVQYVRYLGEQADRQVP